MVLVIEFASAEDSLAANPLRSFHNNERYNYLVQMKHGLDQKMLTLRLLIGLEEKKILGRFRGCKTATGLSKCSASIISFSV